ncbi:hypothetical protein LTR66_005304 [Elasticomyces elasticus]|nr:hypothetical protein LTR50_000103 [Elasticomyces elasticus]KAK4994728.1 hypothetical protein LTR66_005304 [Elasticomyces elasticus]
MANQAALFAETIQAMKRTLKRQADASDSEDYTNAPTNRGAKLHRSAAYVRQGRLDNTGGQRAYRKKVELAGYERYTISRNPPRFDLDGDLIEDGYEDEDQGNEFPAEDDPFQGHNLEHLLAPLTSAGELSEHPSLSYPYISTHLVKMVESAQEMVAREKQSLWRMKQLLRKFRGDETWAPAHSFAVDRRYATLDQLDDNTGELPSFMNDTEGSVEPPAEPVGVPQIQAVQTNVSTLEVPAEHDHPDLAGIGAQMVGIAGVQAIDMALAAQETKIQDEVHVQPSDTVALSEDKRMNGFGTPEGSHVIPTDEPMHDADKTVEQAQEAAGVADATPDHQDTTLGASQPGELPADQPRRSIEPASSSTSNSGRATSHRMTTRARARNTPSPVVQSTSPSPAPSSVPAVHPFFVIPATAAPDRSYGLPTPEADETRRLLLTYVQKQEEIVRGAEQLCEGLMRANRLRREIWNWCLAERHVGEMSDGEDWYDTERWGLDGPLTKGKEEEDVEEEGRGKGRRRRGAQRW